MDEISGAPRIVKRKGQADKISANFKKRSTWRWVAFDALHIDPKYQRNLRKSRAIRMAHEWDAEDSGVLVVSKRKDGRYYIIDGQHRWAALSLIENRPPRLYCEVFEGLTPEEEAKKFHDLDNKRANLTAGASFKALAAANDPEAVEIIKTVHSVGMTIDYDLGPIAKNIRAFKTVQEIYHRRNSSGLGRILTICAKAWPESNHSASAEILLGLEIFLDKYGSAVSDKRLITVLSNYDPRRIINEGRIRNGTLSSVVYPSIALAIRDIYNKKLRGSRLPETV
jgi:hypothetical protein